MSVDTLFEPYTAALWGGSIRAHRPPKPSPSDVLHFNGTCSGTPAAFSMDNDTLSRHVLLLGGTGTGKTNLFFHCVRQLKARMTSNDVMIIFDTKGDYFEEFYQPATDAVIGNSPAYRAISRKWNLFREIVIDGYGSESVTMNAQELCRALFADRELRTNNPFFPNAARDLLAAVIITLTRLKNKGAFRKSLFTNDVLKKLLDSYTADDLANLLLLYTDMKAKVQYIKGGNTQSQGVLSELYSVAGDVLTGVFGENGTFSVRDFIRKKNGRTLFIEYDMAAGDTLAPVYSLLFDLSLKETLGRQAAVGNVYLILDELKLLPHLRHLADGINFGRGLGLKILAGLQSVEALDSGGLCGAAAGFSSVVAFRPSDPLTREYVS